MLFTRTFLDEISMGKNSASFLVKLQANENILGGFPLLVTLKKLNFSRLLSLNV